MWCLFPAMREACSLAAGDSLNRRQSMTTWGILGLAVFVSVGMAEWSKRAALSEKTVSPEVLERAMAIATKIEDRRLVPADLSLPIQSSRSAMDSYSEMGDSLSVIPKLSSSGHADISAKESRTSSFKGN